MNDIEINEMTKNGDEAFLRRTRELFDASVERVDLRVSSRLTEARKAAIAAAPAARLQWTARFWAPTLSAAAVLVAVALWVGKPGGESVLTAGDKHAGLEDIEMVASNDQLDLLQNDLEFYDWLDSSPAQDTTGSSG